MEEKFEEGIEKGKDLGREEGYNVAKEAFDEIIKVTKAREAPKKAYTTVFTQTTPETTTTTSSSVQTNPSTLVTTSLPSELPGNQKSPKNRSPSEILPDIAIFFSQTPSVTILDSVEASTTTTALKTRSKTADFTGKHQKVENLSILPLKNPQTLSTSSFDRLDDVARVHTSLQTLKDVVLKPSIPPTCASSSQSLPCTRPQKSELSRDFSQSELPRESLASNPIISAFKTCPASSDSVENCKKDEKSPIFTQNQPNSFISEHFNWADDVESTPMTSIIPTKHPRDLSELRSSNVNPFSSLRRRSRNRKKTRHCIKFWPQPNCQHTFSTPRYHISSPHSPYHPSQSSFATSLDWNQDPRLADLSNALQALGWIRH